MHNKKLFDAQTNNNYVVSSFSRAENFNVKPFNNIGLYIGKEFCLYDIKYNKKIFFIIIDCVRYAIRGEDAKFIYIKEVNK